MNFSIDTSHLDPLFTAIALVLGMVVLDWLLGVAAAVKDGTFIWKRLPDQLAQVVLPYVTPLLAAAVLSPTDWHAAETTAAAAVLVKLIAEVREKVIALTLPARATPAAAVPPGP